MAPQSSLLKPREWMRAALSEINMDDDIQRHFQDLLLAGGKVFESWLYGLPEDERDEIMALYNDGALPGIRLLLGDERRAAELAILIRHRSGEITAVGALELARVG
jgi:hypothetical protein